MIGAAMNGLGVRARMALVDLICHLLAGRGIAPPERAGLRDDLRLAGFRRAARAFVLRRLTGGHRGEGAPILTSALDGALPLFVSAGDAAVGREILETGIYEPHLVALYRRLVKPGMTVVDIGANIGFHALHAALLVGPGGRVIAIEPDPRNAALLRLSLAISPAPPPVELIEAALSDAGGTILMSDLGNPGNSGARFTHRDRALLERLVHGAAPSFRSVPALRWDDHRFDTPIDLVKIDVEGSEPQALRGMERSLRRHRPILIAEFAPANLQSIGGIEPDGFLRFIEELGYDIAVVETGGSADPPDAAGARAAIEARLRGRHHVDLLCTVRGPA
ncbi:MAG TPA: FkbM family methyltransferase [Candidatus Polarisedimenticolia bacterium]